MVLKRISIDFDNPFYETVIQKIIPQVKYPTPEINVTVGNVRRSNLLKQKMEDMYKIYFDYPNGDESVMGVEVFKMVDGEQQNA